ncbi:Uracil-DNA glycosylase [Histomonas meleagridis]|uniref:Uracil-DNA glycosylase n=1 Tax=Histomonas meleagridis TaxID=135588 RepID=UPI003559607A|nr:Uracil-DNA glycosylase [Histomonas meleagridis]KAH0801071.1 Uracil-DNA glycosylase [Histomonas meleagridis]
MVDGDSKPKKKVDPIEPEEPIDEGPINYDNIFNSVEDFKKCLEPSWRRVLSGEFTKPYFSKLLQTLRQDNRQMFPPKPDILNAFKYCPFNNVKVVIVGQDPYHEENQAHGLSFSVRKGVPIPKSLQNIYKELSDEYGDEFTRPNHGCLESWAKQGVLLLNATLTVAAHDANSHSKYGWSNFTNAAIQAVNEKSNGVVFIAWGGNAKSVCKCVNKKKHCLLESGHPSPLSVKYFLGCGHFKAANKWLLDHGKAPIRWNSVNDE